MVQQTQNIVVGRAGVRGRIVHQEGNPPAEGGRVLIELDTGARLLVASELLTPRAEGGYDLPLGPEEVQAAAAGGQLSVERVVPLAQEKLRIGKRATQTKVRVKIGVEEREETVDLPLAQEQVTIERVPINRIVEQPPAVREEGEAIVVPLVEEVLSVQKKLMLREEVRIVRQSSQVHQPQRVTLRREVARIERVDQPEASSPDYSGPTGRSE